MTIQVSAEQNQVDIPSCRRQVSQLQVVTIILIMTWHGITWLGLITAIVQQECRQRYNASSGFKGNPPFPPRSGPHPAPLTSRGPALTVSSSTRRLDLLLRTPLPRVPVSVVCLRRSRTQCITHQTAQCGLFVCVMPCLCTGSKIGCHSATLKLW